MAEATVANVVDKTVDNVVQELMKNRNVTGRNVLEGIGQDNVQDIQSSVEETVRNAVVTASNDVIRNTTNDLLANSTDRLQSILTACLSSVVSRPPTQQFGFGLGAGWISGSLFRKVSRTAAFVVGCGFLAAQAASALGFITVDWKKMRSFAATNIQRIESRIMSGEEMSPNNEQVSISDKIMFMFYAHMYLSSGFLSGLIIGLTF